MSLRIKFFHTFLLREKSRKIKEQKIDENTAGSRYG